jgi:hypothetical protein
MVGISLGTALLGSAIIGGGAAAIGASSNSSAINRSTDAQVQANRDSLAAQQNVRDSNNALLAPWAQRGNAAGEMINALLGVPTTAPAGAPALSGSPDYAGYVTSNPDLAQEWQRIAPEGRFSTPGDYGQWHYANYGQAEGRNLAAPTAVSQASTSSALGAFDNYLNSAGYKFQLGEANKGANAQFAASGALDSGAAVKAAQDRAQNMSSGFFNNYLALLGNQQGAGLSAASAVAGVGTNYANNVTNLNSNMANALGNAATAKANNTNALLGNLSSSFGTGLGALSTFGKAGYPYGGTLGGIY